MADLDTSLATCPGCGKEIRWEHPRSRVNGTLWHRDCQSDQSAWMKQSNRINDILARHLQHLENLDKIRRGQR